MAAKKKEAEGIALLSMYNDDEDMDPDDEEAEEDNDDSSEGGDIRNGDNNPFPDDTPPAIQLQNSITESHQTLKSPAPPSPQLQMSLSSPVPPLPPNPSTLGSFDVQESRRGPLGIVDYAHDETAMSPEIEEGEMMGTGRVMFGAELQIATGKFQERTPSGTGYNSTPGVQATSPQLSFQLDQSKHEASTPMDYTSTHSEGGLVDTPVMGSDEPQQEVDLLENFLPPTPNTKCSEELQEKINKFLKYKSAGKSFNADLRNRKDYRNPDFLVHAVTYQEIDQIGTCFSKDVFDPNGYDPSDYYDKIEEDMRRDMEKKEQEKKKGQKVEFVQGGVQSGIVIPTPKISTQISASGLLPVPATADVSSRDRQNKKTKWDKVDDRKNQLQSSGQDNIATTAALLSAANAGAGYTAFAQQKRREAEEKRSSERKSEKRS